MGPTPGRPAVEEDEQAAFPPAEPVATAFPELGEYVDLVNELEEILRGAAAQPVDPEPATPDAAVEVGVADGQHPEPPLRVAAIAPTAATLRTRARVPRPEPQPQPTSALAAEAELSPQNSFWQVDDNSWAAAPAWREMRRTRRADLFIIGALVVLIAGGGAYSALRVGGDRTASLGDGIAAEASRAETGLGVPFTPIGRTGLLRNDPTAPVPSLDAAVAGAEVTPLPVIVEPAVTEPIFLADAAVAPAADPAPLLAVPEATAPAPAALGGPLVPFNPGDLETGVAVTMTTTVTTWVNMRAGPDNAEPIVIVVSPNAEVTVRACDYWCSVTVDGRDGYIFQDFLVAHP